MGDKSPGESIEAVIDVDSEAIDPGDDGDKGDDGVKPAKPIGIENPWVN